ncbi:class I SAM-dependent methyltransferase [Paenibacillus tarimensis]
MKNYDRLMKPVEEKTFLPIRTELLKEAYGNVLEVGCGTGINFSFYRDVKVTALEPNSVFRDAAIKQVNQAQVPIQIVEGSAEAMPFDDDAFDTVVGTLVFCSIPDPTQAVREVMRVCKPGGKILLFEHVRHEHTMLAAMQDFFTPLWKRLCDGCHLNRSTAEVLIQEGVEIVRIHKHMNNIFISVVARNPMK